MIDPATTLSLIVTLYAQILGLERQVAERDREIAALRAKIEAGEKGAQA